MNLLLVYSDGLTIKLYVHEIVKLYFFSFFVS
jgi:hypothetical protein